MKQVSDSQLLKALTAGHWLDADTIQQAWAAFDVRVAGGDLDLRFADYLQAEGLLDAGQVADIAANIGAEFDAGEEAGGDAGEEADGVGELDAAPASAPEAAVTADSIMDLEDADLGDHDAAPESAPETASAPEAVSAEFAPTIPRSGRQRHSGRGEEEIDYDDEMGATIPRSGARRGRGGAEPASPSMADSGAISAADATSGEASIPTIPRSGAARRAAMESASISGTSATNASTPPTAPRTERSVGAESLFDPTLKRSRRSKHRGDGEDDGPDDAPSGTVPGAASEAGSGSGSILAAAGSGSGPIKTSGAISPIKPIATPPATHHATPAKPIVSGSMFGALTQPSRPLGEAGSEIGRYKIQGELGRGGMGAVLVASDGELGREVAMKVIIGNADHEAVARFRQEAQINGQLEHPNITPIHELGVDPSGHSYFTMKLVRGQSLTAKIKALRESMLAGHGDHEFSLTKRLEVFKKICDAIAYAHARGIIHRDLKPDNIMVGAFGEVLVMDWGLARPFDLHADKSIPHVPVAAGGKRFDGSRPEKAVAPLEQLEDDYRTLEGDVMGTPSYMSPEQARGEVAMLDARSDIYALGIIFYEMLTLTRAYAGSSVPDIIGRVRDNNFKPPVARVEGDRDLYGKGWRVPRELEAVVLKAMAARPDDRYATAELLAADIDAFIEGRTLAAVDYSTIGRLMKWVARNKLLVSAAAAMVLVAATVFVIMDQREQARLAQEADDRAAKVADFLTTATARMAEARNATDSANFDAATAALNAATTAFEQIGTIDANNTDAHDGRVRAALLDDEIKRRRLEYQNAIDEAQREAAKKREQEAAAEEAKRLADARESKAKELAATAESKLTGAGEALLNLLRTFDEMPEDGRNAARQEVFDTYDTALEAIAQADALKSDQAYRDLRDRITRARTQAEENWLGQVRLLATRQQARESLDAGNVALADGRMKLADSVQIRALVADAETAEQPKILARAENRRIEAVGDFLLARDEFARAALLYSQIDGANEARTQATKGQLETLLELADQSTANREFQIAELWLTKADALPLTDEMKSAIAASRTELVESRRKFEGYDREMESGRDAYKKGDYSTAIDHFQKAQRAYPSDDARTELNRANFSFQMDLAAAAAADHRYAAAKQLYDEAENFADPEQKSRLERLRNQVVENGIAALVARARENLGKGSPEARAEAAKLVGEAEALAGEAEEVKILASELAAEQRTPDGFAYVPGGPANLGSGRAADTNPVHSPMLAPFYMAIREVTVGEFSAFVSAGGYTTREFWSDAGWAWLSKLPVAERVPAGWAEQTRADVPVVGVCAFEADAFARWKSREIGHPVRIPTADEWEVAARHAPGDRTGVGHVFPWGDEWAKGNLDRVTELMAAGVNTADVSGFGCLDMGGNACEWVTVGGDDSGQFGLRGASNLMPAEVRLRYARTNKHNVPTPDFRSRFAGFRLLRPLTVE